jgi:hypothetical protein
MAYNPFTSTAIAEALQGKNPYYQIGMNTTLPNQQRVSNEAWARMPSTGTPEQQVAEMDALRKQGIAQQIAAAGGVGADLAGTGAGTLGTTQSGAYAGQKALQGIAGGMIGPQFNTGVANNYQEFMNPALLGAKQALENQANMAWNKGAAGVGGGAGGFMSSGRNAALGQAQENAATTLGSNQQALALQAAQLAAAAGQQAGMTQYQGQLQAGSQLGNQALQGAQLTGALQNAQLLPGQTTEAGGVAYQQQRQNELNAAYQNQLMRRDQPLKDLATVNQILGTTGTGTQAPNVTLPSDIMSMLNAMNGGPSGGATAAQRLLGGAGNAIGNILGAGAGAIGNAAGNLFNSAGNEISNWWNGVGNYAPVSQAQADQIWNDYLNEMANSTNPADWMW